MASAKRKRENFAEAIYRPSHIKSTDLQTTNRRTSRRSLVSTQAPAASDVEKGDINRSSDEVDESIATLKLAAESVTVRVLRETADEQARVIQVMRSTINAKDLKNQKLYRKIERRDKRVGRLSKRVERVDFALFRTRLAEA
ncbi:hypothetical protein EYC80_010350 [Monilinia laxa]|uniref:Uncharacterized protein n=1 Tax=Monilinia laxa TaxID=61186 RepID=A0A5N6JR73_MONLA|nr:hypothetical protein EYC80_010350 [Monilinia laxa]